MRHTTFVLVLLAAGVLAGCDLFGGESAEKLAAAKEADDRAIGSACRHAGRAIEDCFALNRKADKASVFAGWRDMNDYMRENKIDAVPPQMVALRAEPKAASAKPEGKTEAKPDDKAAPDVATEPAIVLPDKRPPRPTVVKPKAREF